MMDILGLPAKHFEVIPPRNAVLFPSIYISYPFFSRGFPAFFCVLPRFRRTKTKSRRRVRRFHGEGNGTGSPEPYPAPPRVVATPVLCPDRSNDNRTNRTDRTNRKARSENLFPFVLFVVPFVPFVLSHSIRPPGSHDRVF